MTLTLAKARHVLVTSAVVAALGAAVVVAPAGAAQASWPRAAGVRSAVPVGGPALAGTGIVVGPGVVKPPDVADTFVVVDVTTGNVIAAKGAHVRMRPASTLKTLTALTLLNVLPPTTVYVARRADVRVDGTRVGMIEGTRYTVDDLFDAMLLTSANDATSGLVAAAGGPARVVALMTRAAGVLQARDTTVKDPSGLDAPGQYSSAYDLALIGRAAMRRPDFRAYVVKKHDVFPGRPPKVPGQPRPTIPIENKNDLLTSGYPGMVGVKVGYTSKAGNTYIGQAERGAHAVLVVLMKTHGEAARAERKLLDWAFANVVNAPAIGVLVEPVVPQPAQPSASTSAQPLTAGVGSTSGGSSMMLWLGALLGLAAVGWVGYTAAAGLRRRRLRDNPLGLPPLRGR